MEPSWGTKRAIKIPETSQTCLLSVWDYVWDVFLILEAVLEPSWGPLGALLGSSWALLEPSWGHLVALLGLPRASKGPPRAVELKSRERALA